jgi:predicted dehydrogenase
VRFGLIGTGFWATTVHAQGIAAHPQAELVGVWGRDQVKAATLAAQHGAQPFSDVDELIAVVEAVAFAVPPDIQAEFAVRAAAAGRSLLLEKPLALTLESADRLVQAVRWHGCPAMSISRPPMPPRQLPPKHQLSEDPRHPPIGTKRSVVAAEFAAEKAKILNT